MKSANITLLAATEKGWRTAEKIAQGLEGASLQRYRHGFRKALETAWHHSDAIICVMAAGIVVRCLSGLCRSKYQDPCVIVVDESGTHAISLLSGHIGGGNELAAVVASICGGTAVITTGSDVSGHTPLDLWSIEQNLSLDNPGLLSRLSARLIDSGRLRVFQDKVYIDNFPEDFVPCAKQRDADIVISLSLEAGENQLRLIPRLRYIGLGCRRGASLDEFEQALQELETLHGINLKSVAGLASIDIKKDETGLLEIGRAHQLPIRFFSKEELDIPQVPSRSETVHKNIGIYGVCEAAALLAASSGGRAGRLIIEKIKWERITAAVAQAVF
jgi:cobalt-precorrin 5A hydrolase